MAGGVAVDTSVNFALSAVCEWSWWTCVRIIRMMYDNDELDTVTDNQSVLWISCGRRLTTAICHPFLPASSKGCIASTHMTSDSPICPTCLFQFNDMTSFKLLTFAPNELESLGKAFFLSLKGILNCNATEILTFRLRIASFKHVLNAQFRCAVAPTIHSLDTKF
ncbi:hypothetical protein TNCV_5069981 [Trichonephila clavipes]|nr:hypothetical protein TNCV_5069981 [Trichonephila clavipes]